MLDEELKKRLLDAGIEIMNKIGVDSQMKYMQNGGMVGSKISIRSGRLVRSVLGQGGEQIRNIIIGDSEAVFSIGSKVPYSALHELGGVRTVTQAMRKFFWYKWKSTGNPKWRYMTKSNSLMFPKREYLRPAVYDNVIWIKQLLEKKVGEYLKLGITKIVTGDKKAMDTPEWIAQKRFG